MGVFRNYAPRFELLIGLIGYGLILDWIINGKFLLVPWIVVVFLIGIIAGIIHANKYAVAWQEMIAIALSSPLSIAFFGVLVAIGVAEIAHRIRKSMFR